LKQYVEALRGEPARRSSESAIAAETFMNNAGLGSTDARSRPIDGKEMRRRKIGRENCCGH
jgi:hypothetical protein